MNRASNHIVSELKHRVFKNETIKYERNPAGARREPRGSLVAHGWTGARFEARRDLRRRHQGRHQDDPARPPKAGPFGMAAAEARPGRACVMTRVCEHCSEPLPSAARRHARFCSAAHRAAHHRSSTAARTTRGRFLSESTGENQVTAAYVAIVPDERYSGMYRLKRTDGTLSDMVNLTRAKDALLVANGRL